MTQEELAALIQMSEAAREQIRREAMEEATRLLGNNRKGPTIVLHPQEVNFNLMYDQVKGVARDDDQEVTSSKAKTTSAKTGKAAPWPPLPSRAGHRFYVVASSVTTRPGIYAGWRSCEKCYNKGRSWAQLVRGEVVGFPDLYDAVAYYFFKNEECWTVALVK